jgi:predicted double-glycine peptidase
VERFCLLNQIRQSTEYSCGASALRSVLTYWGKDVDEAELMKLLGTTSDEGSSFAERSRPRRGPSRKPASPPWISGKWARSI